MKRDWCRQGGYLRVAFGCKQYCMVTRFLIYLLVYVALAFERALLLLQTQVGELKGTREDLPHVRSCDKRSEIKDSYRKEVRLIADGSGIMRLICRFTWLIRQCG